MNNAGISGPAAPVGEYPVEGWDHVIAINLSGVFYGMRAQLPAMARAGGSIVNMASILAQVGFRQAAAYVAAKHGILGLTQTAALEYGPQKIRINAVGPGFINTPLLDHGLTAEQRTALAGQHAMGRRGEASEVGDLLGILFGKEPERGDVGASHAYMWPKFFMALVPNDKAIVTSSEALSPVGKTG